VRRLVSNSVCAKKDRNGPPSANQVISTAKSRCGHAVCTFQIQPHLPPVLPFLLKQKLSPKDIGDSFDITKLNCLMTLRGAMGPKCHKSHKDLAVAIRRNSSNSGLLVLPTEEWQRDNIFSGDRRRRQTG